MGCHCFEPRCLHDDERVFVGTHNNKLLALLELHRLARARRDDDLAFFADSRDPQKFLLARFFHIRHHTMSGYIQQVGKVGKAIGAHLLLKTGRRRLAVSCGQIYHFHKGLRKTDNKKTNMKMSAYKFIVVAAILSVAVLLVPIRSMADTTADLNAQIQELYAQIKQLQAQLTSGSSGFCYSFNNNVSIGQTGGDVTNLQTALRKDGESVGVSGSFDEQTASAVSAFQEKYRSDVLAPVGLPAGTGYVGTRTRMKLNSLFGCGIASTTPPVMCPSWGCGSYIPFPTSTPTLPPIAANQSITVLSPKEGETWPLGTTQTIKWVSTGNISQVTISLVSTGGDFIQSRLLASVANDGSYSWTIPNCGPGDECSSNFEIPTGKYYIQIIGSGIGGDSGMFSVVAPVSTNTPSLVVLSPNGGEAWTKGTTQTIRWQDAIDYPTCPAGAYCVSAAPRYYDITLQPYYPPCVAGNTCPPYLYRAPYTIVQNVSGSSYSWSVGNVTGSMNDVAPDDSYTIQICRSGTDNCDSSDSYFKIASPVSTGSSPQILYPQGGEVLQGGTVNYISWNPVSYDGTFDVSIIGIGSGNSYLIAQGVAAQATNKQSIQWIPRAGAYQKDTQFIAQVCRTGTNLCSKSNGFTIIFATSTLPPIGISTTPPVMCPSWGCGLYVPFPISTSTQTK